jgi:outer membrane lipoprotein carrier protein
MKIIINILLYLSIVTYANCKALDIKTFQANFKQTIVNNTGKKINYTGNLSIKQPYKMVWNYTVPIKKYVHINKYNVVIVEPELEQAIFSNLNKEVNILNILSNVKKIKQNYYQTIIDEISYNLTIKNGLLTKIDYKDKLDNKVDIVFTNIKQNKPIDNDVFRYHIPTEYDIIRNDN